MALTIPVAVLFRVRTVLLLCVLAGVPAPWAAAVLAAPPQDPVPVSSDTVQEYPGIEQLTPLSTILGVEASDANVLLDKWANLSKFMTQAEDNQQVLLTLDQRMVNWGPVTQWSEGRLLSARQRLIAVRTRQLVQLEQLAVQSKAIEEIRQAWSEKLTFWSSWQKTLQQGRVKVPAEAFQRNLTVIQEILVRVATATAALTEQQQKLSAQQGIVTAWVTQVDGSLGGLHGPLFEPNAAPLLSGEFFRQFDSSLWTGLGDDLKHALDTPADFAPRQGWIALLQLVFALVVAWQIHRRACQPEPVSAPWRFLFRHPLAGGVFVALIGGALLYISPPPLWQWSQRVLGIISATVLISAMLERPRLRRVIITLAVLFIISSTFRLVGLVQPLYRLYLAGVCVIAIPLCLAAARRQRLLNQGRIDLLVVVFYLGALAGTIGIFAQLVGYSSLTSFLVEAFLGSTFVFLFTRMALHLGAGGITALLSVEAIGNRRIVRRLGPETGARLNLLLHVIIIAYACLYLLVQWRVYLTPGDAWVGIRTLTFKLGELQVSMDIVLMTCLVLYLTFIISWLLQALLDAEYMTPRGMEHGVKFAIKTLVHYTLILLGFLVAISVAGIDMSKFAILAGALGVGIGFGLQNIVNNFISGLILLFERPIKIGDTVSIDNEWGTISSIGLRATVIETFDRSEVIVPNSELIAQKVTNWTLTSHVTRVVLPVGVAYGTPLEDVVAVLLKITREHAEVLGNPAPSAIFTGFGDSAINFELRAWIARVDDRLRIRSELGLALDRSFRAAGIVIPFPQRDLHLRSVAPNLQGSLNPGDQATAKTNKDSVE